MKILFISHDLGRAGAQILLLKFLAWLKKNHAEIAFEILVGNKTGELYAEYSAVGPVHIWEEQSTYVSGVINKLSNVYKRKILVQILKRKKFDLIYSNTIVNGHILNELTILKIPVITHVHELAYWINRAGDMNLQLTEKYSHHIITPSESVKQYFLGNKRFQHLPVETIYEHICFDEVIQQVEWQNLRKILNIPMNAIVVGASGTEIWRKAKDWFIPVAKQTIRLLPDRLLYFVWIGGCLNYELEYDLKQSGLSEKVLFVPHLPNANKYFHDFDIFAMLSREDPFPIVNLEAAALGIPIICFDNAGGTPEFVAEGGGIVVPYADLGSFSEQIARLVSDEKLRTEMGNTARNKVHTKHDINIIGPQMVKTICKVVERYG